MKLLFIHWLLVVSSVVLVACSSFPKEAAYREDVEIPKLYHELSEGISLQEAINMLDFSGIDYSSYQEDSFIMIRGVFRNVSGNDSLVSTSIQFDLYFDLQREYLFKKETREFYTGM